MTSSDRKAQFLGMPIGTASNRLKKMIMLSLLREFGKDTCYKCGLKLEDVTDLTIEHIEPWEGRDAAQ